MGAGPGVDRRGFLRLAGLGAIGLAGLPAGWRLARPGEALGSSGEGGGPEGGRRRWAMVVDLRPGCPDDCRACIDACNAAHNIPAFRDEADRRLHEIKWLWKTPYRNAFPGEDQPYAREGLERAETMVLCNHCEKPPCARVCPTGATFPRPDGIVTMDFHRCIGCRYCMAACPYGARSFNWRDPRAGLPARAPNPAYPTRTKGVVEKCSFCAELLDGGGAPACVGACAGNILVFGDLHDPASRVRALLREHYTIRRRPELGTGPQVHYIV